MTSWKKFMDARMRQGEKYIPWFIQDKILCSEWCDRNNIPSPEIYGIFESPDNISFPADIESFVLKPTKLSTMHGVMVLDRNADSFYERLSKRNYRFEQILDHQRSVAEKYSVSENRWLAEEVVEDVTPVEIPLDYKFYAFRGEVALILVIDRNVKPSAVSWFDGEFRPLNDSKIKLNPKFVQQGNKVPPAEHKALLESARRASFAVGTAFSRIDLYNTERGPLLGEVTLTPGGLYFADHYEMTPAMDRWMGAQWALAEAELNVTRDVLAQFFGCRTFQQLEIQQRRAITELIWHPYKLKNFFGTLQC